jgi:hypothetical protein
MDRLTLARPLFRAVGFAALMVGFLSGCGQKGGTYHVSGSVTFNGNPVPAGKIYFMPDNSKGNSGATGYANIVDGKYDTAADGGKATVGGAMIVRIEGFDPSSQAPNDKKDTSGEEVAKTLFPTHQTTVDLPKEKTTKDFDVPASAAKRKDKPEQPGGESRTDP